MNFIIKKKDFINSYIFYKTEGLSVKDRMFCLSKVNPEGWMVAWGRGYWGREEGGEVVVVIVIVTVWKQSQLLVFWLKNLVGVWQYPIKVHCWSHKWTFSGSIGLSFSKWVTDPVLHYYYFKKKSSLLVWYPFWQSSLVLWASWGIFFPS